MASDSTTSNEPLLRHLQPSRAGDCRPVSELARQLEGLFADCGAALVDMVPPNVERSDCLRKLIEARDAALRAAAEGALQPLESASSS